MADVNSNINISVDTAQAMSQLRALERQITSLNRSLIVGSKQNAQFQKQFSTNLMHNVNATGKFTASMTSMQTATEQFSSRLDSGKLSLREYYRNGMASTKTFGKMFGKEHETLNKVIDKRVKTLQTQYVQLGRNAQGAMQAMKFVPKKLNYDDLNTSLMRGIQRQQIFNKLLSDGSTRLLNFGKNTQWAGRQLMIGFTIPLVMLGAQAIRTFKEIEVQSIRFRKVYGNAFTDDGETKEALRNVRELSREFTKYGLTIESTMAMAASAAQQGQFGSGLISQVREANKLAILGGIDQEKALETTVSLTNAFGVAAEDLAGKINFLNAVENQTILSLEDITKAAPIAGNVVKQLGGDVEDLAFFLTAMREGGINANQGANALKSGLARIINPTTAATKKLSEFGIDLLGIVSANTGDITATLVELSTALNALGDEDRARAIEKIFGRYQFTRISTLLQNITKEGSQASRTLEVAAMSAEELAILSERELKIQADSPMNKLASSIQKLKEQLAPIGEIFVKALIPVVEFFGKIFEKFNNLPEGIKKAISIAIAAIGTIGPVLLMSVGLVANGIANLLKLFGLLRKGYQQLAFGSTDVALKTQYMTNEELENTAVTNTLYSSHQRLSATYQLETASLNALTSAYRRANIAMAGAAGRTPGAFTPGALRRAQFQGRLPLNSGTLSVPGTGNRDTVPAMLTPGEAVVPQKQSKKHRGLLRSIIADKVPGFRLGGIIGQSAMRMFGGVAGKRPGVVQSGMGAATSGSKFYSATQLAGNKIQLEIPSGTGPSIKVTIDKSDKFSIDRILEENATFYSTSAKFGKLKTQNEISHIQDPSGKLYYALTRKGFANKELSARDISSIRTRMPFKDGTRTRKLTSEIKNAKARILSSEKAAPSRKFFADEIKDAEAHFVYGMRMTKQQFDNTVIGSTTKNRSLDNYLSSIKNGTGGLASAHIVSRKALKRLNRPLDNPKNIMLESAFINRAYKSNIAPHRLETAKVLIRKLELNKSDEAQIAAWILKRRIDSNFYNNNSGLNIRYSDAAKYNQGVFSVPGPNVNKDVVPAMLTPGEAVIPRDKAKKYRPLISSIIADRVPGFNQGTDGLISGAREPITLSRAAEGRITNAVREQQRLLRQQNRYTEEQIKDSIKRFKKLKVQEELSAASARKKQELNKKAIVSEQSKQENDKAVQKNAKQQRRMAFSQKFAGVGMGVAFGGPMIAGAMAAKDPEGFAAKHMMTIMAVSMLPLILPLFTNIPLAIAAALVAPIAGIYMYNKKQNDAIREQARLVDEISATTEKMQKVGEMTDKVGASQVMSRKREGATGDFVFPEREGAQFGSGFLKSEVGKLDLETFQKRFELMPDRAMREFSLKLATYVSDGVLESSQAGDIARQIGVELGDQVVGLQIRGKLRELLTADGKDITKEPFEIRLQIAKETTKQLAEFTNTGTANQRLEQVNKEILQKYGNRFDEGLESRADQDNLLKLDKERIAIEDQINAQTAQAGALAAQGFEAVRAQIDAVEVDSAKQIEKLEVLKKQTKDLEKQQKIQEQIDRIESSRISTVAKLEDSNTEILSSLNTAYKLAKKSGDVNTFFVGLDEAVKNKFKGGTQEVAAKQFNALAGKLGEDSIARVTIQTQVAGGLLGPLQASGLLTAFVNEDEELNKVLNLFIKGTGIQNLNRLQSIVGTFKDKELAKEILFNFGSYDENTFNTMFSTMELLKALDMEEVNLENFVRLDNGKAFEKLGRDLQKIESLSDVSKKSVELKLTEIGFPSGGIDTIANNWDYFGSLPAELRKSAISTFMSIQTVAFVGPEAKIEWARQIAREKTSGLKSTNIDTFFTTYLNTIIDTDKKSDTYGELTDKGELVQQEDIVAQVKNIINGMRDALGLLDDAKKKIEKGKVEPSFLDDLVKRLRDVRDNTIKVTKGFAASKKGLLKIFSGKLPLPFSGIEQDLAKIGFGENFINLMVGMEPEEYKRVKKELFNFSDNNKSIKSLTELGRAVKLFFDNVTIGKFQVSQALVVQKVQNQTKAMQRLTKAGISSTDAFKELEDAELAAAIANEDFTDEEIKKVAKGWKESTRAVKIYTAQQELAQKSADFKSTFKDTLQAISDARKEYGNLPEEIIQEIIDNPALRNLILEGQFNDKFLLDSLEEAIKKRQFEIKLKMQTREGMQALFEEGYSKAMEWFDARETKIDLEFQFKTLGDRNVIDDAQDAIDAIEYKIDDLQAGLVEIEDAEKLINDKYDKRVDALEKVQDINESIIDQQKSQLTIADALTQGDISAAAKAVQDLREKQASDMADKQRSALDAGREVELGSIRNSLGQSRVQIEAEIAKLQKEVFNIEEKTLEPAQERVRLAGIEKREAIESLTLLGETRLGWEAIKNRIDMAKTSSDDYQKSILLAKGLVDDLVNKWLGLDGKVITTFLDIIERRGTEGSAPIAPTEDLTKKPDPNRELQKGPASKIGIPLAQLQAELAAVQSRINEIKSRMGSLGPKALENSKRQLEEQRILKKSLMDDIASYRVPSGGGGVTSMNYLATGGMVKIPRSEPPPAQKMNKGGKVEYMPMGGLVPYMRKGGMFNPKGTDTVPAMLTPGEFVIRRSMVREFGSGFFDDLNKGKIKANKPPLNKGDEKAKDGFLQKYAKSLKGMPMAEMMGTASLTRLLAGMGGKGDKLSAATLPLTFMGLGIGSKIANAGIMKSLFAIPNKIYQMKNQAKVNAMIKKGMYHGSAPKGHRGEEYLSGTNVLDSSKITRDKFYGMRFFGTSSKSEADLYAGGYNTSTRGDAFGAINKIQAAPKGKYVDFTKKSSSVKYQDYSLAKALRIQKNKPVRLNEDLEKIMSKQGMTGAIMNRINSGFTGSKEIENAKWLAFNNPDGVVTTTKYPMNKEKRLKIPGVANIGGIFESIKKMFNFNKKPKFRPEPLIPHGPLLPAQLPGFGVIDDFVKFPRSAYGETNDFSRLGITKFLENNNLRVAAGDKYRALSDFDVDEISKLEVGDTWYPNAPKSFGVQGSLSQLGAALNATKRKDVIGNWTNPAMARIDVLSENVLGIDSMSGIGRPTGIAGEGMFGPTVGYRVNGVPGSKNESYYLTAMEQSQGIAPNTNFGNTLFQANGGVVPYMNMGGIFKPKGTDTVPAMLTPGEFVVRKYAVKDFGLDKLKAINEGTYTDGSVYNYNLNLNVKSESNADQIAETVIAQIKRIDGQRIRGNRQ